MTTSLQEGREREREAKIRKKKDNKRDLLKVKVELQGQVSYLLFHFKVLNEFFLSFFVPLECMVCQTIRESFSVSLF